jgi:type II secretion system protein H
LVTGNKRQVKPYGFTLIELLVVLVIISITLGMVSLSLPNNEHRQWKDITHRLIVSLNQAKDETTLYGAPISFQIDSKGWRFLAQNLQDESFILGDALAHYSWPKKTIVDGVTQFQLDEPDATKTIRFKMIQGSLTATIRRRRDGYFESE